MKNVTESSATANSIFADDPSFGDSLHKLLVESITEYAVFGISPSGSIISWNAGAQRIFGYPANEVLGKSYSLIFTPEDIRRNAPAAELAAGRANEQHDYERWHVRKNGTQFWGTNSVHPMFDDTGTLFGFAKLVCDITERHLSQTALKDSEQRLQLLTESVDDCAIFSVAIDGTITSWNGGAQAIFGYSNDDIVGAPFSLLYTADDRHSGVLALELDAATMHGYHNSERWLVRKDGTRFLSNGKLNALTRESDNEPRSFVKIVHDVTERKRLALELHRHAFNDHLTQLPNRAAFFEHVRRAIALMKRRPAHLFAVLFIDLDRFKAVNDTYGHIVADSLLGVIARRLEQCVRSGDIVARLGGDEFAILLNGIDNAADASFAGERIGIELSVPVAIEDHVVHISASVGIALGSVAYETPEDILRDADTAMYAAKAQGRSCSVMYATEPPARRAAYPHLETELREVVERGGLRVAYQPIMALGDCSIVGFEALVRWQHPRHGLLQPADFVTTAEEIDAIIPIDRWVFGVACRQLKTWQSSLAAAPLRMSVNFSSKQFSHPDLLEFVKRTIMQTNVDPHLVQIEITESAIIERSERTLALVNDIRALGIALHIDDFGTGYSSLALLANLPFDALKIDRSFIAGMNTFRGSGLVRSMTALAQNLGVIAVAEGVETLEQQRRLESFECDFVQGFLFSPPLDTEAADAFLSAHRRERV